MLGEVMVVLLNLTLCQPFLKFVLSIKVQKKFKQVTLQKISERRSRMSRLSSTDTQEYWQKWTDSRDTDAGDALVRKYMPLVSYHVQRISVTLPKSVNRDELNSLGMIGLYDALEKFDPSRDLKFDTYASFRIRGAIIDGLRKEDWLPRSAREKSKKVEAAI